MAGLFRTTGFLFLGCPIWHNSDAVIDNSVVCSILHHLSSFRTLMEAIWKKSCRYQIPGSGAQLLVLLYIF